MVYDSIIIGGGIAGITAAIYLKQANKNVLLIEKGPLGGTLNKISKIENYPGFKSITGPDLAYNLYEQVKCTFCRNVSRQCQHISQCLFSKSDICFGRFGRGLHGNFSCSHHKIPK